MQMPPIPPDPDTIAAVVIAVTFCVSGAAVLIFRPLAKRYGERIAGQRAPAEGLPDAELARVRQALDDTSTRLERLEQRLDFTERLLSAPRSTSVSEPGQLSRENEAPRR